MARTKKNAALDYQALRTQLRDGRYESLYVIYGDERFLIEKLIDGNCTEHFLFYSARCWYAFFTIPDMRTRLSAKNSK